MLNIIKHQTVAPHFSSQDWKEKYIHINYTRIFTENLLEQVSPQGHVSTTL